MQLGFCYTSLQRKSNKDDSSAWAQSHSNSRMLPFVLSEVLAVLCCIIQVSTVFRLKVLVSVLEAGDGSGLWHNSSHQWRRPCSWELLVGCGIVSAGLIFAHILLCFVGISWHIYFSLHTRNCTAITKIVSLSIRLLAWLFPRWIWKGWWVLGRKRRPLLIANAQRVPLILVWHIGLYLCLNCMEGAYLQHFAVLPLPGDLNHLCIQRYDTCWSRCLMCNYKALLQDCHKKNYN